MQNSCTVYSAHYVHNDLYQPPLYLQVAVFHVIPHWNSILGAAIILATIILLTFIKDQDLAKAFKRFMFKFSGSSSALKKPVDAEKGGNDNAAFEPESADHQTKTISKL